MSGTFDIGAIQQKTTTWFYNHVWTPDTLTQSVIILIAFALGWLFFRFVSGRITTAVNNSKMQPRIKRVLHNLKRLVLPLAVLILLFFANLTATLLPVPGEGGLIDAASALLVAWIFIRLAVQVIDNSFVRNLFALAIWAIAALSILGVLDETLRAMDALGLNIGSFRLSALTVVKGVLAVSFLLYSAVFIATIFERRMQRIEALTPSSKVLISKVARVVLIVFALLIGITAAGIDMSLLAVFSGAVGLGVGFGLQKVISNLFSGILLLMDKSIKPGDIIEIPGGTFGWVQHMGARYTEIVTRDNKSYLIPNEDFVTHQVVNWSHGDTLVRLEAKFGVHYDSDPHLVKKIAEKAALRPDRVVSEPQPMCHLIEFGDSSLIFSLRYWIKDAEKGVTNMRGAVMLALWDAFKENGIKIPYPHREVFVHDRKAA